MSEACSSRGCQRVGGIAVLLFMSLVCVLPRFDLVHISFGFRLHLMGLDGAIDLLAIAKAGVKLIPVFGSQLGEALEMAKSICEVARVRGCPTHWPRLNDVCAVYP
jgi:hypothetical protein